MWSPHYLDLTAPAVLEAHALALSVIPWTVNEPADMERILAMEVDGMISDRPDLLREVLQQRGSPLPSAPAPA